MVITSGELELLQATKNIANKNISKLFFIKIIK